MEENLRDSSMMSGSDYEHLKAWQNKPDLDYYLSDEHWNYRVNLLIYDYLKNRYEGNEVGVFINLGLNSSEAFKIDYEKGCYGVMFNEAYYFCSFVLTTPVPQTKITFLEGEAETLCHVELAKPIIAYHILVMTGFILCLSNVQNDAVGRFLKTLSSYNHTHYFGFEFQHFENYIKIGLNCVAAIMRDGLLQPPGKLQPEYDYMGRDRYLRNTIPWYRLSAEELDKNVAAHATETQGVSSEMEKMMKTILDKLDEQNERMRSLEKRTISPHQQARLDFWNKLDEQNERMRSLEKRTISPHQQARLDFWNHINRYIDYSSFDNKGTSTASGDGGENTDKEKRKRLLATNTVLRLYTDSGDEKIDVLELYRFIKLRFVDEIKFKYEWYALKRFLKKYNLLLDCDNEQFATQMNSEEWFGYLAENLQCSAYSMNTYNYLNGVQSSSQWAATEFPLGNRATKTAVSRIYLTYENLVNYEKEIMNI